MYGLKQASILAYQKLVKHLNTHGYYPVINTNAIFFHKTRIKHLCLCVDDFRIKYHSTDNADHILNTLVEKYTITTDWEGN